MSIKGVCRRGGSNMAGSGLMGELNGRAGPEGLKEYLAWVQTRGPGKG